MIQGLWLSDLPQTFYDALSAFGTICPTNPIEREKRETDDEC